MELPYRDLYHRLVEVVLVVYGLNSPLLRSQSLCFKKKRKETHAGHSLYLLGGYLTSTWQAICKGLPTDKMEQGVYLLTMLINMV